MEKSMMIVLAVILMGCSSGYVTLPNPNFDGDIDLSESETEETEVDGDSEVTEDSDSEESEESETEEVDSNEANEESETEESEEAETEELPNPALQGSCPDGLACFISSSVHICVTGTWTVPQQTPCQKTSDCPEGSGCAGLAGWETGYCVLFCQPSTETECVPTFGPHSVNSCCDSNGSWRPVDYEVNHVDNACTKKLCGDNHDGKAIVNEPAGSSCDEGRGPGYCDGEGRCQTN